MTYSVVIEYDDGCREIWDSDLSYQDAIEAIGGLKAEDLAAAQSGIPIMNCRYWIKKD